MATVSPEVGPPTIVPTRPLYPAPEEDCRPKAFTLVPSVNTVRSHMPHIFMRCMSRFIGNFFPNKSENPLFSLCSAPDLSEATRVHAFVFAFLRHFLSKNDSKMRRFRFAPRPAFPKLKKRSKKPPRPAPRIASPIYIYIYICIY